MKAFEQQPELNQAILIQRELISKHPDWIKKHAKEFREFIDSNPEIMKLYEENPEKVVREIEERFYH